MKVVCHVCQRQFNKAPSHVARARRVFCSKFCHDAFQSTAMLVEKRCKICNTSFSVRQSESSRFSTCSKTCFQHAKQQENNPNWRGGKSSERHAAMSTAAYKAWRQEVLIRDDYTCKFCLKRGGDLEVDHVKPWAFYPDLRYDVSNGRTLCVSCHRSIMKDVFKHRKD